LKGAAIADTLTPMEKATRPRRSRLTIDEALIALLIGAMNANGHVAADEAARAHHLIWSTRRFRRRSGEEVGELIDNMRRLAEDTDGRELVERAARVIPVALRPAAFALVVDLLLADGTLGRLERRFLRDVASTLALSPARARQIVDVMLVKNQL
jgi:tellurite resistance protein